MFRNDALLNIQELARINIEEKSSNNTCKRLPTQTQVSLILFLLLPKSTYSPRYFNILKIQITFLLFSYHSGL